MSGGFRSSDFQSLTVRAVEPLTDDAVRIEFDVPLPLREMFAFAPGQYLTLRRPGNGDSDGNEVRRPYSICSPPGAPLSVGIRHVPNGRFSSAACSTLRAGDRLEVMPPEGRFGHCLESTAPPVRDALLIAAGSGITPMMSIAGALLARDAGSRVALVYGNRSTASIMFRDALDDLKNRYLERFSLLHLLSRETQDVPLLSGRIDARRLTDLAGCGAIAPRSADAVFVCGPGDMIDTATAALVTLGAAAERIHAERFEAAPGAVAAPASAAAQVAARDGVTVDIVLDGGRRSIVMREAADGTLPTVLTAAADAGMELPFSCTGGMCATCRCKVLEGTVEMAANYSLEPWELAAGFVLSCQSRPTSARLVLDFDAV